RLRPRRPSGRRAAGAGERDHHRTGAGQRTGVELSGAAGVVRSGTEGTHRRSRRGRLRRGGRGGRSAPGHRSTGHSGAGWSRCHDPGRCRSPQRGRTVGSPRRRPPGHTHTPGGSGGTRTGDGVRLTSWIGVLLQVRRRGFTRRIPLLRSPTLVGRIRGYPCRLVGWFVGVVVWSGWWRHWRWQWLPSPGWEQIRSTTFPPTTPSPPTSLGWPTKASRGAVTRLRTPGSVPTTT